MKNDPEANTVELKIEQIVYLGRGLARLDGMVLFVPGVLPGETVRARIIRRRKKFAEAELIEIIEPASARIEPACPLAGTCPGCNYQHVQYEEEIQLKSQQLISFLEHNCKVDPSICGSPVASPEHLGYRNRITLHAEVNDERRAVGYFGSDNRTIRDIDHCPLAMDPINEKLKELKEDGAFLNTLAPRGTVNLRHAEKSGCCFWVSKTRHGAPTYVSTERNNLVETSAFGEFFTPTTSFFQVNLPVMDEVIRHVTELANSTAATALIDLYCGAGIFAIACADAGIQHVLGIDSDRHAIAAAKRNAARRTMDNVVFISGLASKELAPGLAEVKPDQLAVVLDPPRRGIEANVLDALTDAKPANLIYVSCAADTMTRDAKVLLQSGYEITSSQVFDMFPRTAHFESVTHFQKTKTL